MYMSRHLLLMVWALYGIRRFQSSVQCRHLARKYFSFRNCFDVFERNLGKVKMISKNKLVKTDTKQQQKL